MSLYLGRERESLQPVSNASSRLYLTATPFFVIFFFPISLNSISAAQISPYYKKDPRFLFLGLPHSHSKEIWPGLFIVLIYLAIGLQKRQRFSDMLRKLAVKIKVWDKRELDRVWKKKTGVELRFENERQRCRRESDLGSDAELLRDPLTWTWLSISSHP